MVEKMVKAVKVTIERAEGTQAECDGKHDYPTFRDANLVLGVWARTAPKNGGYNKCDFVITYEDGETYEGRFDLEYAHSHGFLLLETHMNAFLTFYAGTGCPPHMTEERYRSFLARERSEKNTKAAIEFLAKYAVGDSVPDSDEVIARELASKRGYEL